MPHKENDTNTKSIIDELSKDEKENKSTKDAIENQNNDALINPENANAELDATKSVDEDSDLNTENIDEPKKDTSFDESIQGNISEPIEPIVAEIIPTYNPLPVKKQKKHGWQKVVLVVLILFVAVCSVLAYGYFQNEKYKKAINIDTYYQGIFIDGIHLGGLTKEQALNEIEQTQIQNESEIMVTVSWDETEEYVFGSKDVNISYDTKAVLDKAYQVGREGTNYERYKQVSELVNNNIFFITNRTIDPSPIEDAVRNIALSKTRSSAEPTVSFSPDKDKPKEEWFEYSDPEPGIETDDEALWQSVVREFENQSFGVIPVPKWEIKVAESIDLREITQEIVSFKTIQARNKNREHNIALACSMISGSVLMPGEEFSMNATTGNRTKAAGFKEANTIVGGNELVPGIAGGVCQVSGTLYNAALRADLEITERYHHSFELGYLSRGRDATVNYGTYDIKFVNNQKYPIYITMYTVGREVYAEIFGAPLENCSYIDIWVKTNKTKAIGDPIFVKDSTVPVGAAPKLLAGHKGITCTVYKLYKDENGEQISSEKLYTDVYKHYAPELHVNPADYEGYINPTPVPTHTPAVTADALGGSTTEPTTDPTQEPVG